MSILHCGYQVVNMAILTKMFGYTCSRLYLIQSFKNEKETPMIIQVITETSKDFIAVYYKKAQMVSLSLVYFFQILHVGFLVPHIKSGHKACFGMKGDFLKHLAASLSHLHRSFSHLSSRSSHSAVLSSQVQ